MVSETIPLVSNPGGRSDFLPYIRAEIDGVMKLFLLDTGAAKSSIAGDEQTMAYKSVGRGDSTGASGLTAPHDLVQPGEICIGGYSIQHPRVERGEDNILGVDLLESFVFEVDIPRRELRLLNELPDGPARRAIRRLERGHLTIPVSVAGCAEFALFDTGAERTVFDSRYVEANPDLFSILRSEDGVDAHGNAVSSSIYSCKSLETGGLQAHNLEIAVFEFPAIMRKRMEGIPMVLGYDVISRACWRFDLAAGEWNCEPATV